MCIISFFVLCKLILEKMSNQLTTLELNKCILSKLWYTSLIVYQENANDKFLPCQSDTVDSVESQTSFTNLM